jgi:hypothetical protein
VSGVCAHANDLREHGDFCVLPVTYSDGWTWRLLWDLIDEGEDVQPEVSHWRTSQMSDAPPDVGPSYDSFGGVDAFWRMLIGTVGDDAENPAAEDDFHPSLSDLVERFRCNLGDEGVDAFDDYLQTVVEFPYYDPNASCP